MPAHEPEPHGQGHRACALPPAGGAFLAAGVWSDGPAASNKVLALTLGGVLMAAGLLAQLLPNTSSPPHEKDAETNGKI